MKWLRLFIVFCIVFIACRKSTKNIEVVRMDKYLIKLDSNGNAKSAAYFKDDTLVSRFFYTHRAQQIIVKELDGRDSLKRVATFSLLLNNLMLLENDSQFFGYPKFFTKTYNYQRSGLGDELNIKITNPNNVYDGGYINCNLVDGKIQARYEIVYEYHNSREYTYVKTAIKGNIINLFYLDIGGDLTQVIKTTKTLQFGRRVPTINKNTKYEYLINSEGYVTQRILYEFENNLFCRKTITTFQYTN